MAGKKLEALKNEAADVPTEVEFEYAGDTYTVVPEVRTDLDLIEAIEAGRIIAAAKVLLGAEQYATFRTKNPDAKLAELSDLMNAASTALGVSLGE